MKAGRILLAEDSVHDVELTLSAPAEYKLGNSVTVVRDGAEALDHLFVGAVRDLGLFGVLIDESPPARG